jgi:hypothetical protein
MRFPVIFRVLAVMALWAAAPGLTPSAFAQGRPDLFTVSDIHVDVVGKSSTEAYTNAIAEGRPRAFQILFRRLTQQKDWARQPVLDAAGLQRISRGYDVANERRSTTRYVADVTYRFNPDAVARLLRSANIAFTQGGASRILVVPMAPNVTGGAWAQALGAPNVQQNALVPFILPTSDDLRALAALTLDGGDWSDVAAAAGRVRATEVALVQASYAGGKVTVTVKRLSANQPSQRVSVDITAPQTLGNAYPAAAIAASSAIDDLWKSRTTIDPSQRGRITADMRIASLQQWAEVQNALSAVQLVTGVTLVAMDTGYARLQIAYMGSADQLREALTSARLSLTNRGGQWLLAPAS